jgi:superfamily II DNA or RNA helicase
MISRTSYPHQDKKSVIILDEAHKNYASIFQRYPISWVLGMTATPFSDMSDYDDYIVPLRPDELRDMGVLVPDRVYCPHTINTSNLDIIAGDFKRDQVERLVLDGRIVGDIVRDYQDIGENRPTVCFAVTVEHSKQLRDAFLSAGISAYHCDASSSEEERNYAKKGLENNEITIVCNVDIFSTGWDCPIVSCIILARPTWSLVWYQQAIGRGLRSYPGKKDCIILDNAGNVYRHGSVYSPREIDLNKKDKKTKKEKPEITVATCSKCYAVFESDKKTCPFCQTLIVRKIKKNAKGILLPYDSNTEWKKVIEKSKAKSHFYALMNVAKKKGYPASWVKKTIIEKYGEDVREIIEKLCRSL